MLKALLAVDGSIPADRAAEHLAALAANGASVAALLLNVQPEILPWQAQGMDPQAVLARRQEAGRRAGRRSAAADIRRLPSRRTTGRALPR